MGEPLNDGGCHCSFVQIIFNFSSVRQLDVTWKFLLVQSIKKKKSQVVEMASALSLITYEGGF